MAAIKNFGIVGVGADVQYGKAGPRLVGDATGFFAAKTKTGALTTIQVAPPVGNDDAVTLAYLTGKIAGGMNYRGQLNALSGTLPDTPATGDLYRITTAGTFSNGSALGALDVGDMVIWSGSEWDRIANTEPTITGTGSRIAVTPTGDTAFAIDIDPGYVGQDSITSVGTIATGTWNGTTIDTGHGGTGLTTYANGALLVGNGSGGLTTLPLGAANTFLSSGGSYSKPDAANVTISDPSLTATDVKSAILEAMTAGTTAVTGVQDELDAVEDAVGLNQDGSMSTISGTNYMDGSVSIKAALVSLDTASKSASDAAASEASLARSRETSLASSITTEASRATTAEGVNAGNLTSEITNRTNADTSIRADFATADAAIQGELDATQVGAGLGTDGSYAAPVVSNYLSGATSLASADSLLDTAILASTSAVTTERTRALAAESTLATSISDEIARATDVEGSLTTSVSDEASRAGTAETSLAASVVAEATRATAAATSLATSVTAEASTARAAETSLATSVSTETTRATGAEDGLSTAIGAETTRAMAAEASAASGVTDEATRAEAAEGTLTANLATETTTARAAETSLDQALTGEITRATAAEGSTAAGLASEITLARGNEGSLATSVGAETTRALAAEATLLSHLGDETTRAEAAEGTLTDDLATEIGRATDAEATLTADLATEASTARDAESALATRASTIEGSYLHKDGSVAFTGDFNAGGHTLTNLATPANPTDATTKGYVDGKVSALGNVFDYIGTVSGGADAGSAFDLGTLTQTVGSYYKVIGAGFFNFSGGAAFDANVGDGLVKNTTPNGWDKIDNSDSTVAAGTNITVDGSADTGYTVNVDPAFATQVSDNAAAITAETGRAEGIEASLTSGLAGEVTRAGAAETSLATALGAEASTARSAEGSLATALTAEATTARDAEGSLATSVADETTRATAAETTLTDSISTEADRATAAEATLTSGLSGEISRAQAAEATLTANLATEIARAEAAEASAGSGVAAEATRAEAAEASLAGSITSEAGTARAAETSLATSISGEVTRATNADASLATAIGAETTRATTAEDALTSSVSDEADRAGTAETSLATSISDETDRAEAAEGVLTTSVSDETTRAEGAESTLTANLSAEIGRATGAETSLTTNLGAEVTRATNKENSLQSELDATQAGAGLGADGSYVIHTLATYIGSAVSLDGATVALDTSLKSLADSVAGTDRTRIYAGTTPGTTYVDTDEVANTVVVSANAVVVAQFAKGSGSNEKLTTTSNTGEITLSASGTATDVSIRLSPQGAGQVFVGRAGTAGVIMSEPGVDLTLSGGDTPDGTGAGDLILRGGHSATGTDGVVSINDALGNPIAFFGGADTGTNSFFLTNGNSPKIALSGSGNVDLTLSALGSGHVIVSGAIISGVADPLLAQDAATKNYVDTSLTTAVTAAKVGASYMAYATFTGTTTIATITGRVVRVRVEITTPGAGSVTVGGAAPADMASADEIDETVAGMYVIETDKPVTAQAVAITVSGSISGTVLVEYAHG